MNKEEIIKAVESINSANGYLQVVIDNIHSCVDIIAEKKGRRIVIKVTKNIDSIKESEAKELYRFANFIEAKPLIVGEYSKNGRLKEDVVYERYSVDCVSVSGLENFLEEVPQPIALRKFGAKIKISGERFRYARRLNNISVAELAKKLNISKSSIYRYESGEVYVSLDIANRMMEVLNIELRVKEEEKVCRDVGGTNFLPKTNLEMIKTRKMPFEMVAKGRINFYEVGTEGDMRTLIKKAAILSKIKNTFENNYPFFMLDSKREEILGVPIIKKEKLHEISSEGELLENIIS